jgi:hypothetical protein
VLVFDRRKCGVRDETREVISTKKVYFWFYEIELLAFKVLRKYVSPLHVHRCKVGFS